MPEAAPRKPAAYGPADEVDRARLVSGASARRYTDFGPCDSLDAVAPCCGRIARLRGDWRRAQHFVLCASCGLAYDVELIEENDGGFAALFFVRDEQPTLTRHHAVEVTTSPANIRKGDVIAAVPVGPAPRKHSWCGKTVQSMQYLDVVRNALRATDPVLVKLTFTSGESAQVDAHASGWVVRRRGTSTP